MSLPFSFYSVAGMKCKEMAEASVAIKDDIPMNRKSTPNDLSPSEREELIRLRSETEYLKAENEAIKKLIALRHEKEAARLKVKQQQSSKSSEKKDIT